MRARNPWHSLICYGRVTTDFDPFRGWKLYADYRKKCQQWQ
jgi:hypothetical protein